MKGATRLRWLQVDFSDGSSATAVFCEPRTSLSWSVRLNQNSLEIKKARVVWSLAGFYLGDCF